MGIPELYPYFLESGRVITDSRKVKEGCIFIALKGPSFDGNQYAKAAIDAGAILAVIDDATVIDEDNKDKYFLVSNGLKALQALAHYHRKHFRIPVIGLTGSNGKTTTKELLAAVLAKKFKVHATQGNFNNHIGVALTLLSMPQGTEMAVIEMGANHPGEIKFLSEIAMPTHGLITNVGKAHLEGFGSFEGVKKTKSELYQFLKKTEGLAFVNKDEPHLSEMAADLIKKKFYEEGEYDDSDILHVKKVQEVPFVSLSLTSEKGDTTSIQSQLYGAYNFNNLMTAAAIGLYFGLSRKQIKQTIENYVPSNNRSQVLEKGKRTFIMDAYNANPVSMSRALDSFSVWQSAGRQKVAIIGDMLELGDMKEEEHLKILEQVKTLNIDKVVLVGEIFCSLNLPDFVCFKNTDAAKQFLHNELEEDALILLKASRSIGLEQLLE